MDFLIYVDWAGNDELDRKIMGERRTPRYDAGHVRAGLMSLYRRVARGFTLIEIAITVMVIGLIVAGAAAMFTAFLKAARSRVASENAVIVQQALQRFVERYGRFPCPARSTYATTAPFAGIEDVNGNTCSNQVSVGATGMARGAVPWKTIGLSVEQVQDGYGNMLTYHVTIAATEGSMADIHRKTGNMTIHSRSPPRMGLPPPGNRNQINSCWTAGADPPANENSCNLNAVVVLVSHGENGWGAYTTAGAQTPASAVAAELENTNDNLAFVKGDPTAEGFDDLLYAWSPDDLLEPLQRRGTIKSAGTVTQEILRNTAIQVSNSIVNSATCAAPCTPPPIANIPLAAPVAMPQDGWGQNLVYSTTHPVNTNLCGPTLAAGTIAFSLTSWGTDRVFVAPAGSPNTNTGRYDDLVINVTVDQMRSQIITRFGSC